MPGVSPYLSFTGNCREAIEFYKSALNAQVLFMQTIGESPMANMGPADNIMHASLKIGDSVIMMSDDPNPNAQYSAGNISLALGLNNSDQANQMFANLSQGGTVIMPLAKTFWADAFGMVADKYGIKWMVNCETLKASKA